MSLVYIADRLFTSRSNEILTGLTDEGHYLVMLSEKAQLAEDLHKEMLGINKRTWRVFLECCLTAVKSFSSASMESQVFPQESQQFEIIFDEELQWLTQCSDGGV